MIYQQNHLHDILGIVALLRPRPHKQEPEGHPVLVHVCHAQLHVPLHQLLTAERHRLSPEGLPCPPPPATVVAYDTTAEQRRDTARHDTTAQQRNGVGTFLAHNEEIGQQCQRYLPGTWYKK